MLSNDYFSQCVLCVRAPCICRTKGEREGKGGGELHNQIKKKQGPQEPNTMLKWTPEMGSIMWWRYWNEEKIIREEDVKQKGAGASSHWARAAAPTGLRGAREGYTDNLRRCFQTYKKNKKRIYGKCGLFTATLDCHPWGDTILRGESQFCWYPLFSLSRSSRVSKRSTLNLKIMHHILLKKKIKNFIRVNILTTCNKYSPKECQQQLKSRDERSASREDCSYSWASSVLISADSSDFRRDPQWSLTATDLQKQQVTIWLPWKTFTYAFIYRYSIKWKFILWD